jgi:hypothetical protein
MMRRVSHALIGRCWSSHIRLKAAGSPLGAAGHRISDSKLPAAPCTKAPPIPISRNFFSSAPGLWSSEARPSEASVGSITSHCTKIVALSHFSMPRNRDTVKAAKHRRTKFKAKVIEWEAREHSRGTRDVPVEVTDMTSRPKPREKASRRPRAEDNAALQGEAAPQPMDIDETFWVDLEEPAMPASKKRVRQPACPS